MLPLTRSRNRARFFGTPFSPEALFAGGTVAGAWYDPSDLTTLFTTSAGTTQCAMPGQGSAVSVGRMLDKSGNGNHAIAFNNTTARPELRARVNLLTYSEEFDNAAWNKNNVSASNTTATNDPLGGTTADVITENTANGYHAVVQNVTLVTSTEYKLSFYVKKQARRYVWAGFVYSSAEGTLVEYDLDTNSVVYSTSVSSGYSVVSSPVPVSIGDGWYLITLTMTTGRADSYPAIGLASSVFSSGLAQDNTYTGDGTSGGYIWGADLRPANIGANVPAYQRIADANTYDTSGFPLYLFFDGIDDSMYTPANMNLSGTDKVAVFAGVRKLSDAAAGIVTEFSADMNVNNGTFLIAAPGSLSFGGRTKGTLEISGEFGPTGIPAPATRVLTLIGDIGADIGQLYVNGVLGGQKTTDQGTGNYGTYPIYIGARGNSNLWLNGQIYSLIIAGSAVSAGNISATEQWVANKTGIVIP